MKKIITPRLVQGNDILIVSQQHEDWLAYDGFITYEKELALSFYGADCALIAFWDSKKIGICHCGWRGLVFDIINRMSLHFTKNETQCFISPFLHSFEITKDQCYELIMKKFGKRYFSYEGEKIIFNFKNALLDALTGFEYSIDDRSTYDHKELGSWRRDGLRGNGTQNHLVIMMDEEGEPYFGFFKPKEVITRDRLVKVERFTV